MRILAIDPGHTTGIALKDFNEKFFEPPYTSMPVGFFSTVKEIHRLINAYFLDLIVVEKFTINAATAKKTTAGSNEAIEIIGATKFMNFYFNGGDLDDNIGVEEQKPVDAKNFCTDEKLRRIGWYKPGKDHARDAMRHLLLAAVRHNAVDLAALIP